MISIPVHRRANLVPAFVAGADLLSGLVGGGAEGSTAAAGGESNVSDMLTMSPAGAAAGGSGDGAGRKTQSPAAGDSWLGGLGGLGSNGEAAPKAGAALNGAGGVGGGSGPAPAPSGSLLDDWAGGGGGGGAQKTAAETAADRSQMLQEKVGFDALGVFYRGWLRMFFVVSFVRAFHFASYPSLTSFGQLAF